MRPLHFECLTCGSTGPFANSPVACAKCGKDWFVEAYDYERARSELAGVLNGRTVSLWKYFPVLPVERRENIVTCGEGGTPLLKSRYLGRTLGLDLYIKDEGCKPPTYTFKDRGATLAVSALKESGIREVALYTTGNIGIAVAYYCREAGIKATVFCQKSIGARKREMVREFGATLVEVDGTYKDAQVACQAYARDNGVYCDKGAKSFYRRASKKTMAYEIFEQLGNRPPKWYFQSVSGGLGPLGVARGFHELREMRFTDAIPRIGCIQVEGCNPMVQSFNRNVEDITEIPAPKTRILTLATGSPMSYPYVFRVVKASQGVIGEVREEDAEEMVSVLKNEEGVVASEAAAVAMAGIKKLAGQGLFSRGEIVVFASTGRY